MPQRVDKKRRKGETMTYKKEKQIPSLNKQKSQQKQAPLKKVAFEKFAVLIIDSSPDQNNSQ